MKFLYKMSKSLIGVCQMSVSENKLENFMQAKSLIEKCKKRGAVMAFLPEACDYMADSPEKTIELAEKVHCLDNDLYKKYSSLAQDNEMWLSFGGLHRKCEGDLPGKIHNTHMILDAQGNIQAFYDKCHLFDVDIPNEVTLKETDRIVPGRSIIPPLCTPIGKIGMMVCYDMRFPQISTMLRQKGADVLTYPSAFTVPTGHAHWQVLLRARAIENQCYVVAAAQVGKHNTKRVSYGHSMVIDPWGTVLACAADQVGIITAEIDLKYLENVRTNMPVINHVRNDLY